jgi:hypothetical protein
MPKLWAGRGVGRRGAAPLMPPRWLRVLPPVFASWSARLPVGCGLTGSDGRPGTQGSGRNVAGPGGGAAPGAVWVAPPPLSLPGGPTPAASTTNREHGQRPDGVLAPMIRKRVVLLPHARSEATDTRPRYMPE